MQKNSVISRSKKACTDPTHKTENILFKIAIGLVIAITFNTFTSAFLLFSMYSQSKLGIQPQILKNDLGYVTGEVAPTATKRVVKTPTSNLSKAVETQVKNNLSIQTSVEENAVNLGKLIESMNILTHGIDLIQSTENIDWRRSKDVSALERNIRSTAQSIQTMISACDRGEASCPFDSTEYKNTWRPHLEQLYTLLIKLADVIKNALADQKITAEEISLIVETGKTIYNELANTRKDVQKVFTAKLLTLTNGIESQISLEQASKILSDSKQEIATVIAEEGTGHKAAELLEDVFTNYSESLNSTINAYHQSQDYQGILSTLTNIKEDIAGLEENTFIDWLPGIYETAGNLLKLLGSQQLSSLVTNLNSTLANPASNPNFYGVVAMLFLIDYGINPEEADEPWASLWGSLAGEALTITGSVQVLNVISGLQNCVTSNVDSDGNKTIDPSEWKQCIDSTSCIPNISSCVETKLKELVKILETPMNLGKIPECLINSIKTNALGCVLTPNTCVDNILTSYQSCMSS